MTYRTHHNSDGWHVVDDKGLIVAADINEQQARAVAKTLNELPTKREFKFEVRAVRHLTAEITITAADEEAARAEAEALSDKGQISWDESHAEDFSIDSVELTP